MTVDELAQEIRRVDGSHSLGAGALAEALLPFILSRLDKAEAGWQPIETAPKDGGAVDLWANGERYADCFWMRPTKRAGFMAWCRYSYDDAYGPVYNEVVGATHWRPLPPPPSSES